MMSIPRSEYPRPQMRRENSWINLNGEWEFEFDSGVTGRQRGLQNVGEQAVQYSRRITVPFCMESRLSGVEYKDFMPSVWYRRHFTVPNDHNLENEHVLLHFGAVDYSAQVWIDGVAAGSHRGGYSSFDIDITKILREHSKQGEHIITVAVEDDTRSGRQPSGKQSPLFASHGCMYTRTTGIWQTVWLEFVPQTYIRHIMLTPDVFNEKLDVALETERYLSGGEQTERNKWTVNVRVKDGDKLFSEASAICSWRQTRFTVPMQGAELWEIGSPKLYDLEITLLCGGAVVDKIDSYVGMRSVGLTADGLEINGKPVFQRLVLDQGFYPDGIYTAPSDDELRLDIERSMAMGFNGARLHEKVFEPRFLYHADRLGYICWGEHANWGFAEGDPSGAGNYVSEWLEIMRRDYSHPCIIGWCPYNETGSSAGDDMLSIIYDMTRALDGTRPIIDTSGWFHRVPRDGRTGTDIYDIHDYDQSASSLSDNINKGFAEADNGGAPYAPVTPKEAWVNETPYFVSEFGGTRWVAANEGGDGWGYGAGPESEKEFINRITSLVSALDTNPRICGFCYTQLTDVEQEMNGLYTYDRRPKFPCEIIAASIKGNGR